MKKTTLIIATLIFLLGGFLRFYNLGKSSFWVDEINHVYVSQSILSDGSLSLPSGEAYDRAKLFAYATALSGKIFGVNEWSIRLPSAVFGMVALFVIFVLTRRLLGDEVALVSIFLLAIIPFEVGWARTARFYTLFQLFTVLVWYSFYRGFESSRRGKTSPKIGLSSPGSIMKSWNMNWGLLALALLCLLLAISTQVIGVFMLIALFIYLILASVYNFFILEKRDAFLSKHFIFASVGTVVVLGASVAIPQVKDLVQSGLEFSPAWAQYAVAQDRFLFLKFIMGKELFPVGVFFIIGIIQSIVRPSRPVFYSFLFFIVPVCLFTFVFSYRMYQYMYNIFPFFVVIASYGFVNFVNSEAHFLEGSRNPATRILPWMASRVRPLLIGLFLLVLPITEFFKDSLAIPLSRPGTSNGAFTNLEWREASDFVKNRVADDSIILSTLPITIQHYLKRVDFNMNLSDFDLAREKSLIRKDGGLKDFYTGLPFVEDVGTLDSLVTTHESGFIIVDTYRLLGSQYISQSVRDYLRTQLNETYVSPAQTVRVYSWHHQLSEVVE